MRTRKSRGRPRAPNPTSGDKVKAQRPATRAFLAEIDKENVYKEEKDESPQRKKLVASRGLGRGGRNQSRGRSSSARRNRISSTHQMSPKKTHGKMFGVAKSSEMNIADLGAGSSSMFPDSSLKFRSVHRLNPDDVEDMDDEEVLALIPLALALIKRACLRPNAVPKRKFDEEKEKMEALPKKLKVDPHPEPMSKSEGFVERQETSSQGSLTNSSTLVSDVEEETEAVVETKNAVHDTMGDIHARSGNEKGIGSFLHDRKEGDSCPDPSLPHSSNTTKYEQTLNWLSNVPSLDEVDGMDIGGNAPQDMENSKDFFHWEYD